MSDAYDINEIFCHIQELKKEKEKTDCSIEEVDKVDEESSIKEESEDIITVKKYEVNDEFDSKIINSEKIKEIKIEENSHLNNSSDILNESIKKINQVSRMNTDEKEVKDEEKITGFARDISRWNLPNLQSGTCDLCGEQIEFEKNLSGLTIAGNFFACEKCCINSSHEDLFNWAKSKMNSPAEVRPIGLWVIQEKNKNKSILFKK